MGAGNVTLYAIYSKTLTGTFNYYKYQTTKVSTTIYNTATSGTITAPATVGTPQLDIHLDIGQGIMDFLMPKRCGCKR